MGTDPASAAGPAPGGRSPLLAVAAAIVLLVAVLVLPVKDGLLAAVAWMQGAGTAGALAYIALYAVSTVLMLPGSILTLGAGFVYGPVGGFVVVTLGANLGAAAAFLLGRTLMRSTVEGWVEGRPRFAALDKAMGDEGLKLVTLIRLSPIFPFNLINYGLGLTRLTLWEYVLGGVIGMAPGIALFVYLGSTVSEVGQLLSGGGDAGSAGQAVYWLGLVATIAVTVVVTRSARRALEAQIDQEGSA